MTLRPQSELLAIRQHLDRLRAQPWLNEGRQWWPDFLFHCTDIRNVVSILQQGELLSRSLVKNTGLLRTDIASPEVIERTDLRWQDYVRLYFRPKTPTQYRNEGFRPVDRREWNSHCPVPVYLIFNAEAVLSRSDSRFSDGNLGSPHVTVYGSMPSLNTIPFERVYHNKRIDPWERDLQIVHHRHAEVLVPQRMELNALSSVVCRSDAEYKTLLQSLSPEALSSWAGKIGVVSGYQLFHRQWTFVERFDMSIKRLVFRFNRSSETPGPFEARVEIEETATGKKYHWRKVSYQCNQELTLSLSSLQDPSDYTASLYLDGHLACSNRFQDDDLPF